MSGRRCTARAGGQTRASGCLTRRGTHFARTLAGSLAGLLSGFFAVQPRNAVHLARWANRESERGRGGRSQDGSGQLDYDEFRRALAYMGVVLEVMRL